MATSTRRPRVVPTQFRHHAIRPLVVLAIAVATVIGGVGLPANAITPPSVAGTTAAAAVMPGSPGNYMHDADAPWIRPVTARVTSPYGPREVICNPVGCSNSFHDGIDFGSSCGTPIKAISPGRVTFVASAGGYGNRVIIDHGAGLVSIYGHIQADSFKVAVGNQVTAGTVVANVGATGVVTGCHLDLKIRVGGVYVDPKPFMALRGVTL